MGKTVEILERLQNYYCVNPLSFYNNPTRISVLRRGHLVLYYVRTLNPDYYVTNMHSYVHVGTQSSTVFLL